MFLLSPKRFSKVTFSKKSFRNTVRVSNSLETDQDQPCVGPDLDPNWLQRFYQRTPKVFASEERVNPSQCHQPPYFEMI